MRTLPPRRRSYYYGWNILIICVATQMMINSAAFNCFSLFVPVWAKEMNAPTSQIVMAISLFTLAGLIVSPAAGWASDRFPANRLISVGLIAAALGYAAVSLARSPAAISAVYMLVLSIGIGIGTTIPAQSVVTRWFDRRRGIAMGINAAGLVLAGIIFPPIIVLLLPVLGWRDIWLLFAGFIGIVMVPVALLGLYDRPAPDDPFGYMNEAQAEATEPMTSIRAVVCRRNFWVLWTVFLAVLCTFFSLVSNLASIVLSFGLDMQTAGFILSLVNIAAVGGKLLFGVLVDWLGNRVPLVLVALVAALGAGAFYAADSRTTLFLAAIPVGFCGGIWTVIPSALAAEYGSAGFGRAFGLITGSLCIAMMAAPAVARVKETSGTYDPAFLSLALVALLGAGVASLLRQEGDRNQSVMPELKHGTVL